jgi:hypothetical protein
MKAAIARHTQPSHASLIEKHIEEIIVMKLYEK